jgi:hypothetical protein
VLEIDREIVCSRNTEASQEYKFIRSHFLSDEGCFIEAMPSLVSKLEGPPQEGRGQNGQYVYWICMVFPSDETVATHGCKTPADFDRQSFRVACVEAHTFFGNEVVETVCFQEPHADGRPHLNLLVRCKKQYRWLKVAQRLLQHHKIFVGFGQNITSWQEGVVYGRVASDHKPPEGLDKDYDQWHVGGLPTPLEQFLPRRYQTEGFVRHSRLTPLAFYDLCVKYNLQDVDQVWAKATALSELGDRALLSYLLENDCSSCLGKVLKAQQAKEKVRRAGLSREQLLEEFVSTKTCCCVTAGHCHGLMKEILQKNNLDGAFQKEVMSVMRAGRAKMRNICLVGDTDCAKSFLFKGLRGLFEVYERPEGGSHQLHDLLGAEVVFLNDFEYDADAPKWMPWQYFKDFLEGSEVKVAVPKQSGSNQMFKGTAPVFLTASQEIVLKKYGKEVTRETDQMRKRIRYFKLSYQVPEDQRQEVVKVCSHCSARLYLEGKALLDHPTSSSGQASDPASLGPSSSALFTSAPPPKRVRLTDDTVKQLKDAKDLLDLGVLTQAEFQELKAKVLSAV